MAKLTDIAQEMKKECSSNGHSYRTLSGGLRLALYARDEDFVLVLGRPFIRKPGALVVSGQWASDKEVKICKNAFFGDAPLRIIPGVSQELKGVGHIVKLDWKVFLSVSKEDFK